MVRRTLNVHFIKKYNGDNLIQESSLLPSNSEAMSPMFLACHIKSQIFYEWVDIQARSYVKCFMQILKRNIAKKKLQGKM